MSECSCGFRGQLPEWFRQPLPDTAALDRMRGVLRGGGIHTVCQSARCPNTGGCWSKGTATFMILGDVCTRACRFCAVTHGNPQAVEDDEPLLIAEAVRSLGLKYVVITSVTRDDLPDQGAGQFFRVVRAVKSLNPLAAVELLIPDLSGEDDLLRWVCSSGAEVVGHNVETVRRVSRELRPQADHDRSLAVLRLLRQMRPGMLVKSGLMAGLGETDDEILESLADLKQAGCDIVTVGQYLAPSKGARHLPVQRFVPPEMFERYRRAGLDMGLKYVTAGPLVRSSYNAEEGFRCCASEAGL